MFLVIIVDSFCPVLFGKKSLSPVGHYKQAIHYQSFSTCYDVWFKAMMALTKSMRVSSRCKDLIQSGQLVRVKNEYIRGEVRFEQSGDKGKVEMI